MERKRVRNTSLKDLSKKHVSRCISAIIQLSEERLENKKLLFAMESQPIFMQVTCIRVPKVPRRQMRIVLPHSLVSPSDEVALIVSDLQKGRRRDYEPTVEHYRNILRECDCTRIKDVLPMNRIKTEYDQYELKRKLVSSYDCFLVDGKIAGHVTHLLGKIFLERRKMPTSVRMSSKNLNDEIALALRKTNMLLHSHGDTHVMEIGNTSMEKEFILENVLTACNSLCKHYPGGWENIRSIRLKSCYTLSLPIYITLKNKNKVCVPIVKAKRPKAYRTVEGELTTLQGDASVIVTPEGDVKVMRTKTHMDDDVTD